MMPPRNCASAGCTVEAQSAQPEQQGDRRDPRQWAVTVPKSNGAQILFGRYTRRQKAETVAAALRGVGCAAVVSGEPRGTP